MTSASTRNPFELISLMALLKHNIGLYMSLARLHAILGWFESPAGDSTEIIAPDLSKGTALIKEVLIPLRNEPAVAEVQLITKQIDRIMFVLQRRKSPLLIPEMKELYRRIDDLLTGQMVYIVSPDKAQHYEDPFSEWGKVRDSFPSSMDAIEEMEKCFALGRNTACVFHCIGIMDRGLIALGRHLRTGLNPHVDTWETTIGNIQGAINRKRDTMDKAAWKRVEAFYEEALSDLRSVKNAWRNPTMHFRRIYTEEQAAKVRERVKEFMIHLCARVHERKQKQS